LTNELTGGWKVIEVGFIFLRNRHLSSLLPRGLDGEEIGPRIFVTDSIQ
jgi:hypothetical protein